MAARSYPLTSPLARLEPVTAKPLAPPVTEVVRTRFERFELKFWVTEAIALRVLAFSAPFLVRDHFNTGKASQRNTSLYLDSAGFRFAEQHEALAVDRSKLRIRVYGEPLGDTAFFEVKRKTRVITRKDRFALPIGDVARVLAGSQPNGTVAEVDKGAYSTFGYLHAVHRATPKVYVACYRDAYESRDPKEDVRLTVDRELVYQPAYDTSFDPSPRAWREIHTGDDPRPVFGHRRAMLELKFDGTPPAWMRELIRAFGLQREAFSKYVTAIRQLRGRS